MPAPDYSIMTMDQLQAELQQTAAVLDATYDARRQIIDMMEKRKADAGAQAKVKSLSPAERDALKSVLNESPA